MKKKIFVFLFGMVLFASSSYAQLTQADLDAASGGRLAVVAFGDLPPSGTFWSWANGWATPFDIWPDLTCYDLGEGSYLLDDRGYSYDALGGMDLASGDGSSAPEVRAYFPEKGDAPGVCGFIWLSVDSTNSNAVLLSVHNTLPGQTYTISSSTNIALAYASWTTETNLTGGAGDITQALIAMSGRSNLFFRASESRDYSVYRNYTNVTTFTGLGFTNTGLYVPDTMGSIGGGGTGYFLELLNDQGLADFPQSFVVYDRTGGVAAVTTSPSFFGTSYAVDSRVLFDSRARRWVASTLDLATLAKVILKVSRTEDPTDLSTNGWYRYEVAVGPNADFDTLGLDDNGLYVAVAHSWSNTNSDHTVVAIRKAEAYSGSNIVSVRFDLTNDIGLATIQPAVNFDAVAPSVGTNASGYAWLVAKGPPALGDTYRGGAICYRRLQWSNTTATIDPNWFFVTNSTTTYQDYFDFEITNIVAPQATSQGGGSINLWPASGHLAMTAVRSGYLWTCHTVGLSGTNGSYSGDRSGSTVDRSAMQWFRLGVDTTSGALSYSTHGRVYDNVRMTNALWYYFGSIMANCAGDMVMGFSGSSATNYLSAFYTFRLAGGAMPTVPSFLRAGVTNYTGTTIGDYSATSLDPFDDWKFWTVQEYADPSGADSGGGNPWRTVITEIRPGP